MFTAVITWNLFTYLPNMEAVGSSETLLSIYQTTRSRITEVCNLDIHFYENRSRWTCVTVCSSLQIIPRIRGLEKLMVTHLVRKIPNLFWNLNIYYRVHKSPPFRSVASAQFQFATSVNCGALTRSMNVSYIIGNERASSLLFQCIVAILWVPTFWHAHVVQCTM
jgi:hypothetical protein